MQIFLNCRAANGRKREFPPFGATIDDYAKDGGEELVTKMHSARITNP